MSEVTVREIFLFFKIKSSIRTSTSCGRRPATEHTPRLGSRITRSKQLALSGIERNRTFMIASYRRIMRRSISKETRDSIHLPPGWHFQPRLQSYRRVPAAVQIVSQEAKTSAD